MTVIAASYVRVQSMADGTLRVVMDVEPNDAQAAFKLLGSPGTPLALARLKTPSEKPAEDRPKGGEAAKWLGQRCNEDEFADWLLANFPEQWEAAWLDGSTKDIYEASAKAVRAICGVKSRSEVDSNPEALKKFHQLRVLWNQARKA